MPDNTAAEDPRSPTPDPVGVTEEQFQEMMRLLKKSFPTSEAATGIPAPTSEPLSAESALEAQKKQNTGITKPEAALRNEAARRAVAKSAAEEDRRRAMERAARSPEPVATGEEEAMEKMQSMREREAQENARQRSTRQ